MSVPSVATEPTWTLGDRLAKAREHAGIEQAELADRLLRSRATISNYENDVTRPADRVVRAWAEACGVDYAWLVGDDQPAAADADASV